MDFSIGFDIPINIISKFWLIFSRIVGIIFFAPVFSNEAINYILKLSLTLTLSILIFPFIEAHEINIIEHPINYLLAITKELLIGIVIGFAVRLVFTGIHLAGDMAGRQMGLGFAEMVSPESGVQMPIIAELYAITSILIFLAIDGHHWLLVAISKSFDVIPFAGLEYSTKITEYIVTLSGNIFVIGFRLAAPIICTIFLTNLALGLISRAIPQVNVFILGFPLKITMGLVFISVSIRLFSREVVSLFYQVHKDLEVILKFMSP